jgi:hypothetical protein
MVKVKPVKNPRHGEVTAFTQQACRLIDDTLLDQRTIAITYISVIIKSKYPYIQREKRRQLAARCLEQERKRRKEIELHEYKG